MSVLALLAGQAQANEFCVSTAQQLQDALTASSDGGMYSGESNIISVVQGTYKIGAATANGPFHYHNSTTGVHFIMNGGYDATCTTQTRKASLTVLDGNHANQVLTIRSTNGPVTVTTLTIQNGESAQYGSGVSINANAGDNSSASLIDSIIQNNHTTGFNGGISISAAGSGHLLLLEDNLIVGNSADMGDGAGGVVGNGSESLIYNNTVTQNTTSASGETGGLRCAGSGICDVFNNIFWNNTNFGLYLTSTNSDIEYNDYGTLGGLTPDTSQGNVSVPPKFVNANGGDFHLAGDSPLLGASPQLFGSFDLDGNAYPSDGKSDLGAYEETIFTDNFDGG
jgi:hypothetical protein